MSSESNLFTSVIVSSAVFAALVTSTTNMIVSVLNNRRLKIIEKQKSKNDIDKYRYERLYEMLLNWHNYDSDYKGESPGEIAFNRLLNGFLDNLGRYDIIRPLLDERFIRELDRIKVKGNKLLGDLIDSEKPDGTHTENFNNIKDEYFETGSKFADKLKDTINQQLKDLLMKS